MNQSQEQLVAAGKHSKMAQCDCLERPLSVFFYKYGRFVARNPVAFVVFPIILTFGLSIGFLYRNVLLDATYLYTPRNAPSRFERQIIHQNWPTSDGHYQPTKTVTELRQCSMSIVATDGGNILRPKFAQAVEDLNDFIQTGIVVEQDGTQYKYDNLCIRDINGDCFYNQFVPLINTMYVHYQNNLTFPAIHLGNRKIYIASSLGGVTLRNGTNVVKTAKAWMFSYHLKFYPQNDSELSGKWEKKYEIALRNYKSKYLRITYFHSQTLSDELHRNADHLIPKFAVTFMVLVSFAVICAMSTIPGTAYFDWVVSKSTLSLMGVLNAGFGVVSSIGLLSLLGMDYNDIVAVMPFLVISIGVDNMFLMIAAFRRTNRALSVEKRMAESLSDSAISITITALTDALSFGVGAITPIPAVQIFCAYTAVAIVMTFIYQLTFFVGLMAIFGRMEQQGRNSSVFVKVKDFSEAKRISIFQRLFNMGTLPDPDPKNTAKNFADPIVNRFFRDWFSPVLMNPIVKALVICWLCIYLGFAIWGCTHLREGLKPVNLLVSDSYAIPHYEALEKYFWPYGVQVQVVVNNPPDLSLPSGRKKAYQIVDSFANTSHTIGPEGVQFWLDDYMKYLETFKYLKDTLEDPSLFYSTLREDYFTLNSYAGWRDDVLFAGRFRPRGSPGRGAGGGGASSANPAFTKRLARRNDNNNFSSMTSSDGFRTIETGIDIVQSGNGGPSRRSGTSARGSASTAGVVIKPLDPNRLTAYRFMVGIKDFSTTNQQRSTMQMLRSVADKFPEHNITTFSVFWLFGDQYTVILPNTLQNIGIALTCMVVISLVLIPQPLCAVWVALCIASIDTGVVGYMTLWGVNLDAISMITIIMSIGFSVDFSAHVSYGYVISDQEDPGLRVCQALGALGWPILQGAISTIFGVMVLATVDAYMIVTFFKTVFLVIVIGAVHGLVFLPVLLSIFVRDNCFALNSRKEKLKAENSLQIAVQEVQEPEEMMHTFGPFGRYGIYLPRLSHNAEYFPGKGDILAWAGPGFTASNSGPPNTVHFGTPGSRGTILPHSSSGQPLVSPGVTHLTYPSLATLPQVGSATIGFAGGGFPLSQHAAVMQQHATASAAAAANQHAMLRRIGLGHGPHVGQFGMGGMPQQNGPAGAPFVISHHENGIRGGNEYNSLLNPPGVIFTSGTNMSQPQHFSPAYQTVTSPMQQQQQKHDDRNTAVIFTPEKGGKRYPITPSKSSGGIVNPAFYLHGSPPSSANQVMTQQGPGTVSGKKNSGISGGKHAMKLSRVMSKSAENLSPYKNQAKESVASPKTKSKLKK